MKLILLSIICFLPTSEDSIHNESVVSLYLKMDVHVIYMYTSVVKFSFSRPSKLYAQLHNTQLSVLYLFRSAKP